MKIVLQGVETNNKGAELMLYAILQEIERRYPNAKVYLRRSCVPQGRDYIKTGVKIKLFVFPLLWIILNRLRINTILRKLRIDKTIVPNPPSKHIDYYFDGSGLLFSDQRNLGELRISMLSEILRKYSLLKTRIVYLPQAFGPIEKSLTKKAITILSKYASLLYARERKSYDYLEASGLMDMNKVKISTDFTSLVEGTFPSNYNHLKGAVCLIPNRQMVERGNMSFKEYIDVIENYIESVQESNHNIFILNHEGREDDVMIEKVVKALGIDIEVVTGLNALETKGLIAESYLVISSRFHGVASSLNSCVPCLATSWNHKYSYLFNDYGMSDCVLSLQDKKADKEKINYFLKPEINADIREQLKKVKPRIQQYAKGMWKEIWNLSA